MIMMGMPVPRCDARHDLITLYHPTYPGATHTASKYRPALYAPTFQTARLIGLFTIHSIVVFLRKSFIQSVIVGQSEIYRCYRYPEACADILDITQLFLFLTRNIEDEKTCQICPVYTDMYAPHHHCSGMQDGRKRKTSGNYTNSSSHRYDHHRRKCRFPRVY